MKQSPENQGTEHEDNSLSEYVISLREEADEMAEREKYRPAWPRESLTSRMKDRFIKFGHALVKPAGNT